jgi:multisubunit Na+/H+ antiporter MnhB subunit
MSDLSVEDLNDFAMRLEVDHYGMQLLYSCYYMNIKIFNMILPHCTDTSDDPGLKKTNMIVIIVVPIIVLLLLIIVSIVSIVTVYYYKCKKSRDVVSI